MTSAAEARAAMLGAIAPLGSESVPLAAARGRILAASVVARRAQPPFAASAMDGYALRSADTPGRLRIIGESAAGHAYPGEISSGEAVRISTGAPMPAGADTVLIQEDARCEGDALVASAVPSGRHVRAAGIDFASGAAVLTPGRRLDGVAIGLAASAGAATVDVARRPRVAVLCAGDELVAPGGSPRGDQIFESCSWAIAARAEEWGAECQRYPLLSDDEDGIREAASKALSHADLVVFIGSASVGPHDHARPAFERLGARFLVRKVDMRPGKPTWFGVTMSAPVLGLPGNPASALVAAELFLRPILCAMQGAPPPSIQSARSLTPLAANGPREAYLRACVQLNQEGANEITPLADQDSSLLSVFAQANALLIRRAHAGAVEAGASVEYLLCA